MKEGAEGRGEGKKKTVILKLASASILLPFDLVIPVQCVQKGKPCPRVHGNLCTRKIIELFVVSVTSIFGLATKVVRYSAGVNRSLNSRRLYLLFLHSFAWVLRGSEAKSRLLQHRLNRDPLEG